MGIGFRGLELVDERNQTQQSFNFHDRRLRGRYWYRGIVIGKLNVIITCSNPDAVWSRCNCAVLTGWSER